MNDFGVASVTRVDFGVASVQRMRIDAMHRAIQACLIRRGLKEAFCKTLLQTRPDSTLSLLSLSALSLSSLSRDSERFGRCSSSCNRDPNLNRVAERERREKPFTQRANEHRAGRVCRSDRKCRMSLIRWGLKAAPAPRLIHSGRGAAGSTAHRIKFGLRLRHQIQCGVRRILHAVSNTLHRYPHCRNGRTAVVKHNLQQFVDEGRGLIDTNCLQILLDNSGAAMRGCCHQGDLRKAGSDASVTRSNHGLPVSRMVLRCLVYGHASVQ
jgi:hypothetical protein